MRIDCLVGNTSVSIFEAENYPRVRVVSPVQERKKYHFIFKDFFEFNAFLRKRLGYETK